MADVVSRIDGKRIYIAGDTDATKETKAVKCDIAIIIGGIIGHFTGKLFKQEQQSALNRSG